MTFIVSRPSAVASSPRKDVNVAPTAASAARTARPNEDLGRGKEQMKARYTSRSTSMQSRDSSDSGQSAGFGFGAAERAPQSGTCHCFPLFLCSGYGR
jgi:hypothetical protein